MEITMNVDRLYQEYIQKPLDLGEPPEEVIKTVLITSEVNRDNLRKASEENRKLKNSRSILYKRIRALERKVKDLDNIPSDELLKGSSVLILEKP